LAEQLAQEHKKLKNQVRFIKMVINKELIVSNRKRAELIKEMFQKGIVLLLEVRQKETRIHV
jgi:DNA topoisomerase-2